MNFWERPPSNQWSALTFRGERIAEVWFKPDGDPLALVFRIAATSFQNPDIVQRLTAENLLRAVSVAADAIESLRYGSASDGSEPVLAGSLPRPSLDAAYLEVYVRVKPPPTAAAAESSVEPVAIPGEWHDLEARWKAVLGLESTVETLRKTMEGLRAELDGAVRRGLTADDKVHALTSDVAEWTKAKSRAHYALPKANEFIHRATWAAGGAERKRLGELFKNPIDTHDPLPPVEEVAQEIEMLRKDRQVLSAKGQAVYQECKAIVADVQGALRRLQHNAAARAAQKKGGTGTKGKSF